jgi:hypothetical protein
LNFRRAFCPGLLDGPEHLRYENVGKQLTFSVQVQLAFGPSARPILAARPVVFHVGGLRRQPRSELIAYDSLGHLVVFAQGFQNLFVDRFISDEVDVGDGVVLPKAVLPILALEAL